MLSKKSYSFVGLSSEQKSTPGLLYSPPGCFRSAQELDRQRWHPTLPHALCGPSSAVYDETFEPKMDCKDIIAGLFPCTWGQKPVQFVPGSVEMKRMPLRIGVVLSGGQAPGGHNVISGLYDFLKGFHAQSQLIGFKDGPQGIFTHNYLELSEEYVAKYRNTGGFDMICSGRHKIETEEQLKSSMDICQELNLDGLLIIGGDDSNTNGAILAEYFAKHNCKTRIIGAPKTIDGDLRNEFIEASFGFDTAIKTYSESIGNLCVDAATSNSRYHFVRLMGRSASNIAFECALQTRANLTFIGEEIQRENRSLQSIADEIVDMVIERSQIEKNFGVVLIPEGLVEFIPEVGALIKEINVMLATGDGVFSTEKLTPCSAKVFNDIPANIRADLLLERDSHGNVQVSRIAMEKLLILMTKDGLKKRGYTGPFNPHPHFFGYEARAAIPSDFDANYCYALGHTAGTLISNRLTGYMAVVNKLNEPAEHWIPGGCPITIMMNIEFRSGKNKPVIRKYLVDLDSQSFKNFAAVRHEWRLKDYYINPGPLQLNGPHTLTTNFSITPPSREYLLPNPVRDKFGILRDDCHLSVVQIQRLSYRPEIASVLKARKARAIRSKKCEFSDQHAENFAKRTLPFQTTRHDNRAVSVEHNDLASNTLRSPMKVGVVLAAESVPGVNNIVQGLLERLELVQGTLVAFKGVAGLLEGKFRHLGKDDISLYINQAGCELLGQTDSNLISLRDSQHLKAVGKVVRNLELDGLVVLGGQREITDAAAITEYFLEQGIGTKVVAVPINADNNMKNSLIECTVGFDTASKTHCALIGNLLTDGASAKKYWYFIKLMGSSSSHAVLEVALQTHPNYNIISERLSAENMKLSDLINEIADAVCIRASKDKNYGTVVIPDTTLLGLPEIKTLVCTINEELANGAPTEDVVRAIVDLDSTSKVYGTLKNWHMDILERIPKQYRSSMISEIQQGKLEFRSMPVEELIAHWVSVELDQRKQNGTYSNAFTPICASFGFEGRSAAPTNFDCALGISHGYLASIIIESELTGYVTSVRGLSAPPPTWRFTAIPISALMKLVPDSCRKSGHKMPTVPRSDVNLRGKPYKALVQYAEKWTESDLYNNPGPIQYSGCWSRLCTRTLHEEQNEYILMLDQLEQSLSVIEGICSFGVEPAVLKTTVTTLQALEKIITEQ